MISAHLKELSAPLYVLTRGGEFYHIAQEHQHQKALHLLLDTHSSGQNAAQVSPLLPHTHTLKKLAPVSPLKRERLSQLPMTLNVTLLDTTEEIIKHNH